MMAVHYLAIDESNCNDLLYYYNFFFSFRQKQEIRDKVKLLLQLADTLLSSGSNVHSQAISHWADAVDNKYKDFSNRIDQLK